MPIGRDLWLLCEARSHDIISMHKSSVRVPTYESFWGTSPATRFLRFHILCSDGIMHRKKYNILCILSIAKGRKRCYTIGTSA